MELRHLRYLLAVVDAGSTTAAASVVRVAQPSLSRQLARLEADLGIELFHHGPGRLSLTPAGAEFLPIARDLVARADSARAAAAALASGAITRITIAAPGTTIADVVAPFIAQTGADEPMITVREVLPAEAYDSLHRGADLAVSSTPPVRGMAGRPVARLPVLAYVPPDHRWSDRESVTVAELAGEPLLLLTTEHRTRRRFDDAALRCGIRYDIAFETSSPQVAQALAAAGHGVAVVSDDPRYELRPLVILDDQRSLYIDLYAAWDRTHYAAEVIASLAERLSRFCVDRYGPAVAPESVPTVPAPR